MQRRRQIWGAIVVSTLASGISTMAYAAASSVPQKVVAMPGDRAVLVTFAPVQNATGYNVYRRRIDQTQAMAVKLNAAPLAPPLLSWIDASLPNGTPFFYSITAIVAGQEGPRSAEVVATPQLPIGPFVSYNIGTLNPGSATVDDHATLNIRASGDGVGDGHDGQLFLATPMKGDYEISAMLMAPTIEGGVQSDLGQLGLEIREGLAPGARHAFVFGSVQSKVLFEGHKGIDSSGQPIDFSGGGGNYNFVVFLRLTKKGGVISAFQSNDGSNFNTVFQDEDFGQDFGRQPGGGSLTYVGIAASAHKDGAYLDAQIPLVFVQIR